MNTVMEGKSSATFGVAMRRAGTGRGRHPVPQSDDWVTGEQLMAEPLGIDFRRSTMASPGTATISQGRAGSRSMAWASDRRRSEHRLVVFDEITPSTGGGSMLLRLGRPQDGQLFSLVSRAAARRVDRDGRHGHRDGGRNAYEQGIAAKKGIDF